MAPLEFPIMTREARLKDFWVPVAALHPIPTQPCDLEQKEFTEPEQG